MFLTTERQMQGQDKKHTYRWAVGVYRQRGDGESEHSSKSGSF